MRKSFLFKLLKKKYEEAKVVTSAFEAGDMKELLESNGHDYKPFVKVTLEKITQSKKAVKMINTRAKEKKKKIKDELEREQAREKKVGAYMKAHGRFGKEVNSLADEDIEGQNETFKKEDYQFDMAWLDMAWHG